MKLDLRFIVPGPTPGSVLVDADGRLPTQAVDGDADEATVVAATECLRDRYGFASPILETHPKWEGVPDGEAIPTLVMTEPAKADWTPPEGLVLVPIPTELAGLLDSLPVSIRLRAEELLAELRTGAEPPALRPRWARRGWHDRAAGWMSDALARAGRPLLEPPKPFYLRGISALLRGRTAGGDVFLKAVFPPFHPEPVVGQLMAERFPTAVPRVVAIEPDEGWLIVDDVAAPWISDLPGTGLAAGARAIVAIQTALSQDLEAFAAAGCPARPLDDLADALDVALGPEGVAQADGSVPPERRERAVAATRSAALRVAALGFPTTIVHGDFHAGNAALVDDHAVIIDWSDAAIGNPAIDLVTWLSWSRDKPDEQQLATDSWIAAWVGASLGPTDPAAVRAAIDDILVVGAAYQVVSYDGILRALEPATRYTMADGAKSYLSRLEERLPPE